MRFFLIIVCTLAMIFFIDTYNKEDEEVIKVESIKPRFTDINASMYLIKEYTKKIEEFKKQRAHLGKIDNEQLIDFYMSSLSVKYNIKFMSAMALYSRLIYENRVLHGLKEDFKTSSLSVEEKEELLKSIKNLVMLNNQPLYELIEDRNKFYAKNMKKYIDMDMRTSTDSFVFNKKSYPKFLFYLNKGEELLIQGIKQNNFKVFNEFINNELEPSAEENRIIEKGSFDNAFAINYWIRFQVYVRYIAADTTHSNLMRSIKAQKTFFDDLLLLHQL